MPPSPTPVQRREHGWCNDLRQSPAFAFYLSELHGVSTIAHREVCAEVPRGSREFHAGRLSGFTDALELIEKKYRSLKDIVELVPE